MVQLIAGQKGEGKTKRLIDLANEAVKDAHGHVVFIDDDNRHIYDLKHSIRFVETSEFPLSNYRELVGFIYGILSQNGDIETIFLDGLYNLIKKLDNEDLIKLIAKLKMMSERFSINFIMTANADPNTLPDEVKEVLI